MMKTSIVCIIFISLAMPVKGQLFFEQGIVKGGVTAGGFSTGQGSGSGILDLYIEPGSIIKKAYLFTYRIGYPPQVPIVINSIPYVIDTANMLTQVSNNVNIFCAPVALFYKDITSDISPLVTSYNITIPTQSGLPICWAYCTAFIYIIYEHPSLPYINYAILLNNLDLNGDELYLVDDLNPINVFNPVGFSIYTDRLVIPGYAAVYTLINNDTLGLVGGTDSLNNSWQGGGVKGHFYYQNNQLFGLDDDTPDSLMGNSDGLADISSYLNNLSTSFNFRLTNEAYPSIPPTRVNINLAYFFTYTTPCDTFTAGVNYNDTLICFGDSVQLSAYGGIKYKWNPGIGLSCDTCANPFAKPDSSILYTCTIYNTDSCSKVLPVKVNVRPPISFTTNTTAVTCGLQDGSITVNNIVNAQTPFTYFLNGLPQSANTFTGLDTGAYILYITDDNGCSSSPVPVKVNVRPPMSFTTNTTAVTCGLQDGSITVTNIVNATAPFTYILNGIPQPTYSFTGLDTGMYIVSIIDSNGCKSDTVSIILNDTNYVTANFSFSPITGVNPLDVNFTYTGNNGLDFIWSFGTGDSLFINNPSYIYNNAGSFLITLITWANDSTCSDTARVTLIIVQSLVIPPGFSPNGDGLNDVFNILGIENYPQNSLSVINRWGDLIYQAAPYNNDWDGRCNICINKGGGAVTDGTYFYVFIPTPASEPIKGSLEIRRN